MTKRLYEAMFLLDNREAKKGFEFCRDYVQKLLTKYGAESRVVRKWDERKLAYDVKHQKRATYILAYFDGPADAIEKIERDCQLSETVLRVLVVRAESVPEKVMEEPFDASIAPQVEFGVQPIVLEEPVFVEGAAPAVEGEAKPAAAPAAKEAVR
jgi:small subunit ribosomal protein S6